MQELKDNLLKSLRLALTNIKIYPATSPLVKTHIQQLHSLIEEFFNDTDYLCIFEMDGRIFINSEEYQGKDQVSVSNISTLSKIFVQSGIKSITFKKGITLNELEEFLVSLSIRKLGVSTKDFVINTLKEKNIDTIKIDEVEFITILKSNQTVKSILQIISKKASSFEELLEILGKVFSDFDKIENEDSKKNVLEAVSKYISSLDKKIVKELLVSPLPPKIENLGLKQQIFNNLTRQQVEEIFDEIINWCKKLRSQSKDEKDYIEKLENLKNFIKLIVESPISKLISIEVFEELFKIGLIDNLPDWIVIKKERKSWIAQLEELLEEKEPTKLLQQEFLDSLQQNIEKLCFIGIDDKLQKLIELMSQNLSNPVIKIRQLSISSLSDINKKLIKYNKTTIIKNLTSLAINFLCKEQEQSILKQYFDMLFQIFVYFLYQKNYEDFKSFAVQLLRYSEEIKEIEPEKSKDLHEMFKKIFDESKNIILSDLSRPDFKNFNEAMWFLNFIGSSNVEILLNAALENPNQNLRNILFDILSKYDQELVIQTIKQNLTPKTPLVKLSRLIEGLDKFKFDFSLQLIGLYKYLNYANKIAIIDYIANNPTETNLSWLVSLLEYEDPSILEHIIDIIISLQYKPAVPKLIKLLKISNVELKKRICIALGILKELEGLAPLKRIVRSKSRILSFKKPELLEVRIAACWALGNFITLPEVKSLLIKLSKSTEAPIAKTAKEVLSNR